MASTLNFISAFTTVFFVFGIGFVLQKVRPMSKETLSDLSKLVIDVLLPFYLFANTATNASIEAMKKAPVLILAGMIIPLLSSVLLPLLYKPLKVSEGHQPVFNFAVLAANTAFLGIPICEALFGSLGAFYAVLYDFGITIIMFTLGVWLLSGGKSGSLKSLLVNPLIIAVLIGLVWAAFGWDFPVWLEKPFNTVGAATLPIALLVTGAQVGNIQFKKKGLQPDLIATVLLRLFIVPGLLVLLFSMFKFNSTTASVIILEAAMPVAVSTTIMAKTYGADGDFAASITLWTTLISLFTLPLITLLLLRV